VQVIDTVAAWRKALDAERAAGRNVGLVPTMGALHAGHASLVAAAARDCEVVGVTVFVNPLQFGAHEDLDAYPRTLDADVALAEANGAGYVFAPSVTEMYPGPVKTTVAVADITTRWEGAHRPGHFDGVGTVVTKLLSQAGPCRAYFGEKDYQQLAIVRRLVTDLSIAAEIVGCPIVRETDGLALSSRNVRLTPEEREVAPALHRALLAGAAAFESGSGPEDVERAMGEVLSAQPLLEVDYAVARDPFTLDLPASDPRELRLLVAARLGSVRLIDNLGVVAQPLVATS